MQWTLAEKVAEAVLYDGYVLYPLQASVVKNRQSWTFGGIYPRAYTESHGGADTWREQTQFLIQNTGAAKAPQLEVRLRFLHLQERVVGACECASAVRLVSRTWAHGDPCLDDNCFTPVASLRLGDRMHHSWQESLDRQVCVPPCHLDDMASGGPSGTVVFEFSFPATLQTESLPEGERNVAGVVVSRQAALEGKIEISAQHLGGGCYRVTVQIVNCTGLHHAQLHRDAALLRSLVAAHLLLGVEGGQFISMLDPPFAARGAVADCKNIGLYPVLTGDKSERSLMLASPIFLHDFPQIASENAGALSDRTEIEEIMTPRILIMADEEKAEAGGAETRAREMLDRTARMTAQQIMALHGVAGAGTPREVS